MSNLRNAAGNPLKTGQSNSRALKLAGTGMAPYVPPTPGTPQPSATIQRMTSSPKKGDPLGFDVTMQNIATVYVALRKGGVQEGSRQAVSGFGSATFTPAGFGTDYSAHVFTASSGGQELASTGAFTVADNAPPDTGGSPEGFEPAPNGWRLALKDDFDTMYASYDGDGGQQGLNPTNWRNRSFGTGNAHQNSIGYSGLWNNGKSVRVMPEASMCRMSMYKRSDDRYYMDGVMEPQWGEQFNNGMNRWWTWQSRARLKMSTNHAPGIGLYVAIYPWHNVWSTEIDVVETPQNPKVRIDQTLHFGEGNGKDMGIYGRIGASIVTLPRQVDQSQWVTYDCRMHIGDGAGSIYMWVNGIKTNGSNGEENPWMWTNNWGVNESMAYGWAGYAAAGDPHVDPNHPDAGVKNWYGYVDWSSPATLDIFIDYHEWWTP